MKLMRMLAATGFAISAAFSAAASPETAQYSHFADSYSFMVGEVEVTALSDGTVPLDGYALLRGASPGQIDELLAEAFLSNPIETSINVYLIRTGDRTILVDVGAGELFGPGSGGKLFDAMSSVGVDTDEVTDILLTHIHNDHIGGLIRAGQPAFPNATIHVSEEDLSFFLNASNAAETGYGEQYFTDALKTVGVYDRLGKVDTFGDGETVIPGIDASLHPGHTPGSAWFTVVSGEESIIFTGDILHVAAIQLANPAVAIEYDFDPEQTVTMRQDALAKLAETRQLIAVPHIDFPGVGRVRATGDGSYDWISQQYRNRPGE